MKQNLKIFNNNFASMGEFSEGRETPLTSGGKSSQHGSIHERDFNIKKWKFVIFY